MVVAWSGPTGRFELGRPCAAAETAGTVSGHHAIHQLVSLAVFVVLAIALVVLARGLRTNGTRAQLAVATRRAGMAASLTVVALMVTVGFGDVGGLVQRTLVALLFGSPVLLAALPGRR